MRYDYTIKKKKGISDFLIILLIALVFLLIVIFAFPSRLGDSANPIIQFGKSFWGDDDKKEENKDAVDSINKVLMANKVVSDDVPLTFEEYKEIFDKNSPKRIFDTEKYCVYETKLIKKQTTTSKDKGDNTEITSTKETEKKAFLLVDKSRNAMSSDFGPNGRLLVVTHSLDEKEVLSTPIEERVKYEEFETSFFDEVRLEVDDNDYTINIFDNYGYKAEEKLNVYKYFSDCYKTNEDEIKVKLSLCFADEEQEIGYTNNINQFLDSTTKKCKEECLDSDKCKITIQTHEFTGFKDVATSIDMTEKAPIKEDITKKEFYELFNSGIKPIEIGISGGGDSLYYYMYEAYVKDEAGKQERVFLVIKKEEDMGSNLVFDKDNGLSNPQLYVIIGKENNPECKSYISSCIKPLKVEGKEIRIFSEYRIDGKTLVSPYESLKSGFCKEEMLSVDIDWCIDSDIKCGSRIDNLKSGLENECSSCSSWSKAECQKSINKNDWMVDIS